MMPIQDLEMASTCLEPALHYKVWTLGVASYSPSFGSIAAADDAEQSNVFQCL